MKKNKFLPLGSIVGINGETDKLLIVQHAITVEGTYYDYEGILHSEEKIQAFYFNKDNISKIFFKGYADETAQLIIEHMFDVIKESPEIKAPVSRIENEAN
ncbi:MAG: DUF4176 domain-containing protein [Streptococcaceae bacterium]|nr:DUF4176 domain-containing protein [Streptococcaceae bacterium]